MTESITKEGKDKVKIFEDLKIEIIDEQLCCACGACVAYCESQSFDVIQLENNIPNFKSDATVENCTECGVCYYICPQTEPLIELMNQKYDINDKLGPIREILAAKTTKEKISEIGQDGGIVSTILYYLFETSQIDAAVVSEYDEELHPQPKLIYNKEDLMKSAGTRYSISSQLFPLKDLYNIPYQVIEEKGIFNIDQVRIAFVGTPCQVRALRKMKFLSIKPAHVVKYCISLFCFENFNYKQLYNIIKEETGISPTNIKKEVIKGRFIIETKANEKFDVELKTLDEAVRPNCKVCDDFAGIYSDISVGSSGAPEGHSMIITRTDTGDDVIKHMLSRGYISSYIPSEGALEWRERKKKGLNKMISLKEKKS
jgi:coenzyme F420 hydrogenase subunit beta